MAGQPALRPFDPHPIRRRGKGSAAPRGRVSPGGGERRPRRGPRSGVGISGRGRGAPAADGRPPPLEGGVDGGGTQERPGRRASAPAGDRGTVSAGGGRRRPRRTRSTGRADAAQGGRPSSSRPERPHLPTPRPPCSLLALSRTAACVDARTRATGTRGRAQGAGAGALGREPLPPELRHSELRRARGRARPEHRRARGPRLAGTSARWRPETSQNFGVSEPEAGRNLGAPKPEAGRGSSAYRGFLGTLELEAGWGSSARRSPRPAGAHRRAGARGWPAGVRLRAGVSSARRSLRPARLLSARRCPRPARVSSARQG